MKKMHLLVVLALATLGVLAAVIFITRLPAADSAPPAQSRQGAASDAEISPPQPEQTNSAALVIDGTAVDPLCFANRSGEDPLLAYAVTDCTGDLVAETQPGTAAPFGENFVSTAYKSRSDDLVRGVIGYRYLGEVDGRKAIWLVENGGGSGVFTSLVLMEYEAGRGLVPQENIAFGDRCNGGVAEAQIIGGTLVYARDLTPYDMLGLTGDADRAIIQSEAAQQLPSCAVCCYGRAQYEGERLTGVLFDERLPAAIAEKTYAEDGSDAPEKCFDDLVKLNLEHGEAFFNAEALDAFIGEVEHVCLGRTEGEE